MKDNIIIEKVWGCDDFFEMQIICENSHVRASTQIYVDQTLIEQLCKGIVIFSIEKKAFVWKSGIKGEEYGPCVEFEFKMKDKLGHINIEVFMEMNDNSKCKHHCCFSLDTELGQLERFGERIAQIDKTLLGTKYILNSRQ